MSTIETTAELFEEAIALEKGAEELYRRLARMFSEHPDVEKFWLRYAEEERGHASYLGRIRDRLPADVLAQSGDKQILEMAAKYQNFSVDHLLHNIHNLEDAYQTVLELESSETNAIFEFILENFSRDELEKAQTFLRVQLTKHMTAIENEFPIKYRSKVVRQGIQPRTSS